MTLLLNFLMQRSVNSLRLIFLPFFPLSDHPRPTNIWNYKIIATSLLFVDRKTKNNKSKRLSVCFTACKLFLLVCSPPPSHFLNVLVAAAKLHFKWQFSNCHYSKEFTVSFCSCITGIVVALCKVWYANCCKSVATLYLAVNFLLSPTQTSTYTQM